LQCVRLASAILEAVHEAARGLHAAGVMGQTTLREFDSLCLPLAEPLKPEAIKVEKNKNQREIPLRSI
jgi:DNA-binding transcriptional regulator YiaG